MSICIYIHMYIYNFYTQENPFKNNHLPGLILCHKCNCVLNTAPFNFIENRSILKMQY